MTNSRAKKIALTGLLFALALTFSFIESVFPSIPGMPPGIKLGLSNIVTMFCLFSLGAPYTAAVVILKAGFSFLMRGTIAGILSLSGGLLSAFVMFSLIVFGKQRLSIGFTSISGAVAHNVGQIFTVRLFIGSNAVFFYLPLLLLSGIVMGTLTGITYKAVCPYLEKLYDPASAASKNRKTKNAVDFSNRYD